MRTISEGSRNTSRCYLLDQRIRDVLNIFVQVLHSM